MFFQIAVGSYLAGSFIYHRWIQDRPGVDVGVFRAPRVYEGTPVPLVYGTCRVRSPILAWSGSQRQLPVGRPPQHVSEQFAYFLDMLYVVGVPFLGGGGELLKIFAGDRAVTLNSAASWTGDQTFEGVTDFRDIEPATIPINDFPQPGRANFWVENPIGNTFPLGTSFPHFFEQAVLFSFVEFFGGSPTQTISDGIDDDDDIALTDTQAVLEAEPFNTLYQHFNTGLSGLLDGPTLPLNIPASQIPSFRNLMTCCMYRWSNGDTTSMPPYGFEVRSLSTGTASDLGFSLSFDADPAAVIYDLLTSPWGKLGLPSDRIDLPSFQAASATLFAESNGYSRAIEQSEDASAIIADILRQIDGLLYEEPTTGKIVLKLVRFDYDVNDLDDINPDNAEPAGASWYQVQGWNETYNQVRIKFTDRQTLYSDGQALGQNAANVINQGGRLRSLDLQFVGCCSAATAQKLASRELAAVSRPQVKASVIVNRNFYEKRPGDVVTLTWPELGIDHMVMRIARVDLGSLHDGRIRIDMVRDIFDVSIGAYPIAA